MIITALDVEGFGVWTGLRLDGLADGLNVFYGPNEAGKSTLMQFVRSVLYGFTPERRRFFPPVRGGRYGGSLLVTGPQGEFQIGRFDRSADATRGEELAVTGADGFQHGGELLQAILCHVDEAIYNNVFAVGLEELQELATLNDTEAAALLYNLTVGLDRVSLVEVMRELHGSRNRLLDAGGGACQVVQLLAEREKLRKEIDECAVLGNRYGRLAAERDQLDREAVQMEEESRQIGHELRILQIAEAARPRLEHRSALDRQLAALGQLDEVSEADVQRLDRLLGAIGERQKLFDELDRQWQELRAKIDEVKVSAAVIAHSPRVAALAEQDGWIRSLEERILELEAEVAEADSQWKTLCDHLKLPEGSVPKFSPRSLAALRPVAEEVRRCRERVAEIQGQAAAGEETHQSLSKKIRSSLDARGEQHLSEATERVGKLVAQLRRRLQIDERLSQMNRHHHDLNTQGHRLMERQMLPASILWLTGLVFVTGVVLICLKAFNVVPADSLYADASSAFAVVGFLAMVAAVAAKIAMERSNEKKVEHCHRQLRMLHGQMQETKREREALDSQLPPGAGTLAARLDAAEKELAGLEELVPLDAQREAARRDSEAVASRGEQAETDLANARRRWEEALQAAGFPKGLSPKQVRQFASRAGEMKELQERLSRRREDLQQRSGELDSLTGRIAQLASDLDVRLAGKSPVEHVRELVAHVRDEEARGKQRQDLVRQSRELRRKRLRAKFAVARLKRRRQLILEQAKVHDEDELRRRAADCVRAAQLRNEREATQREIDAAIAGYCPEEAIAGQIDQAQGTTLENRREQLQRRVEACTAQLKQRYEKRGQLFEQLKAVAENRSPTAKRLELATVEKRIEESIRRWQVLALTHRVLEQVRKTYEQTRQPETLQEASTYLELLTQGHYRRVWTPLDEDVLVLDDSGGKAVSVDRLSRGTREQLFLSLRLALVDGYSRRGAQLPMVLDDVLVNFDSQRAKAAATAIRDFAAAGHQLFVFTCHEHIAQMFQSLRVEVHELPDHTQSRPAVSVVRKPAARQPKRKAPEETPMEVVAVAEQAPPPEPVATPEPVVPPPRDPMESLPPWEEDDTEPPDFPTAPPNDEVDAAWTSDPVVDGDSIDGDAADADPPATDSEGPPAAGTDAAPSNFRDSAFDEATFDLADSGAEPFDGEAPLSQRFDDPDAEGAEAA